MPKIPKLVISGGPCGGKSSSMEFLVKKLRAAGYFPIVVPEAASILINMGITPVGGVISLREFQRSVIDLMLSLEDIAERTVLASGQPKPVILCDRGIMDSRGYVSDDEFFAIAREKGLSMNSMCDGRYSGVLHLRTAAYDAEHAYSCENNPARYEKGLHEARLTDERTLRAWVGHPHVRILHNRVPTFQAKLDVLWKHVCRILGIPEPIEIEKKFLVEPLDLPPHVHQQKVKITQVYTRQKGFPGVVRVRKRDHRGHPTYFVTRKQKIRAGVNREDEEEISKYVYDQHLLHMIKGTCPIKKDRYCFVYRDQYFELDVFKGVHNGLYLLEIELLEENESFEHPPFIKITRDVTFDPKYKNTNLAKCA